MCQPRSRRARLFDASGCSQAPVSSSLVTNLATGQLAHVSDWQVTIRSTFEYGPLVNLSL